MPRFIYTALLWLLLPLVPLRLLWRAFRQPEYLYHIGERFGFFEQLPDKPVIWLHCVSVGETRASAPLVKLLQQRYPDHAILLTHATPTGREAGEQMYGDGVLRAYLPYDLPFAVARFLRHFQPRVGLLMETELWFNLIRACRSKGVPLLLVNARMSLKSARGYARLGRLAGDALRQLTAIAAQSGTDAVRLRELGAPQVTVTGNIKFDVTPPADALSQGQALRQLSGVSRPVFLAASTREGEESLVLDAMARAAVPGLLTVIVPRHPQRFDEVAVLLRERGVCYSRRSRITVVSPECTVLLGDSMGEMPAYYAACDVAFVGGSLLPYGGQNLIEACTLGKPVLIGPYTFNFEQAAAEAVAQGAAVRVRDVTGLATELGALMCDASARRRMGEAGLAFAASNRGAAQRTLQLVSAALEKPAA